MARLARWPGLKLVRQGGPAAPKREPEHVPEVRVRPVEERDIDAYLAAGVSSEIHRMYGGDPGNLPEPSIARARDWHDDITKAACAWMIDADGEAVGHLRLHAIDLHDGRARLAIGLFREGDLGRGIGRQAIELALQHGFVVMKLHRIDLRVLAFNTRAIRCYRACGFTHEGTEREACLIGNTWHDDWLMGILRPEYLARLKFAD
jgi:RimJ/RimL family protein N-acetyltransferase